jgi:hypothetical protein
MPLIVALHRSGEAQENHHTNEPLSQIDSLSNLPWVTLRISTRVSIECFTCLVFSGDIICSAKFPEG